MMLPGLVLDRLTEEPRERDALGGGARSKTCPRVVVALDGVCCTI